MHLYADAASGCGGIAAARGSDDAGRHGTSHVRAYTQNVGVLATDPMRRHARGQARLRTDGITFFIFARAHMHVYAIEHAHSRANVAGAGSSGAGAAGGRGGPEGGWA